jgi:hypothetical protein
MRHLVTLAALLLALCSSGASTQDISLGIGAPRNTMQQNLSTFLMDQPPVVTLTQRSTESAVMKGLVHIEATCQDDDPAGCPNDLELRVAPWPPHDVPVIASAPSHVSLDIELSEGDWWISAQVRSPTHGGTLAHDTHRLYVVDPDRFEFLGEATHALLDFDEERFLSASPGWYSPQEFILQRRDTGHIEQRLYLPSVVGKQHGLRHGALTPGGAVSQGIDLRIYQWKPDGLMDHGMLSPPGPFPHFTVQGPWLGLGSNLVNTQSEEQYLVPFRISDITPRGEAAGYFGEALVLFKNGFTREILRTLIRDDRNYLYLQSDGYHFVWRQENRLHLYVRESTNQPKTYSLSTGKYILEEGYLAYSQLGQIWRRAPDGVEQPLSFLVNNSEVETVGATGEVIFYTVPSSGNERLRRYLGRPGQQQLDLGPAYGSFKYHQGEWYLLLGRGLFRARFQPGERPPPEPVWTPPPLNWDPPKKETGGACAAADSAPSLLAWAALLALLLLKKPH